MDVAGQEHGVGDGEGRGRTLFSNQAVVAVVGVVCVTCNGTAAVTDNTEVEFWMSKVSDLSNKHAHRFPEGKLTYPGTHGQSGPSDRSCEDAFVSKQRKTVGAMDGGQVLVSQVESLVGSGSRHSCGRSRMINGAHVERKVAMLMLEVLIRKSQRERMRAGNSKH